MQVSLKNIVPLFLEKEKVDRSQVWAHDTVFRKGERIQISAPSGSGKTSLVHFLYGLRKDYSGEVFLDDKKIRDIAAGPLAEIRAAHMSIIFQDLRLFPAISVLENIEVKHALRPYHTTPRIKEMAAQLGIENKLSQHAGTCSYGEQQRIVIIRALQQPFELLVMDEPFSHLDEINAEKAMQLIDEEASARGATIILADLAPVPFFSADKILSL